MSRVKPKRMAFYCKKSKYWGRLVRANGVDPDQTAPQEQSDLGVYCWSFNLHRLNALLHCKIKSVPILGLLRFLGIPSFRILEFSISRLINPPFCWCDHCHVPYLKPPGI